MLVDELFDGLLVAVVGLGAELLLGEGFGGEVGSGYFLSLLQDVLAVGDLAAEELAAFGLELKVYIDVYVARRLLATLSLHPSLNQFKFN
jgi:hypothetical protein